MFGEKFICFNEDEKIWYSNYGWKYSYGADLRKKNFVDEDEKETKQIDYKKHQHTKTTNIIYCENCNYTINDVKESYFYDKIVLN